MHLVLDHVPFPPRVDFVEVRNHSPEFSQDEPDLVEYEFQISNFLHAQALGHVVERALLNMIRFCFEIGLDLTRRTILLGGNTKGC